MACRAGVPSLNSILGALNWVSGGDPTPLKLVDTGQLSLTLRPSARPRAHVNHNQAAKREKGLVALEMEISDHHDASRPP